MQQVARETWVAFERRLERARVPAAQRPEYHKWTCFYLDFCHPFTDRAEPDPQGGQEPVGSRPGLAFEPGPAVGLTRPTESLPRKTEKAFLPALPSAYSEFSAVILLRLWLRVCHCAPLLPPYRPQSIRCKWPLNRPQYAREPSQRGASHTVTAPLPRRSLPVAPLIADQRCYGEAPGGLRRGWL
jgi:hypothetical protein